ncbi:hypothetical protein PMAYCL1PPCAC_10737, partial [Pristionchus mayeri]
QAGDEGFLAPYLINEVILIYTALNLPRDTVPYFWKVEKNLMRGDDISEEGKTTLFLSVVKTECRRARDEAKIVKFNECPPLKNENGEATRVEVTLIREEQGKNVKYTDVTPKK